MEKWLNRLANVALVAASCVVVVQGAKQFASSARASVGPDRYVVGDQLVELSSKEYSRADHTVVLYVNSHCQFCSNSMPLYRQIGQILSTHSNTRFVVASSEPESVLSEYLKKNSVDAKNLFAITKVPAGKLRGTPTLAIVDSAGRITRIWHGQQSASTEADILSAILE